MRSSFVVLTFPVLLGYKSVTMRRIGDAITIQRKLGHSSSRNIEGQSKRKKKGREISLPRHVALRSAKASNRQLIVTRNNY